MRLIQLSRDKVMHPKSMVILLLLFALSGCGEKGTDYWIPALKDEKWAVRLNAAEALGNIGDKSAVPALTETLNDKNARVRVAVAGALARLGDETGTSVLIVALNDDDQDVRKAARDALAKLNQ